MILKRHLFLLGIMLSMHFLCFAQAIKTKVSTSTDTLGRTLEHTAEYYPNLKIKSKVTQYERPFFLAPEYADFRPTLAQHGSNHYLSSIRQLLKVHNIKLVEEGPDSMRCCIDHVLLSSRNYHYNRKWEPTHITFEDEQGNSLRFGSEEHDFLETAWLEQEYFVRANEAFFDTLELKNVHEDSCFINIKETAAWMNFNSDQITAAKNERIPLQININAVGGEYQSSMVFYENEVRIGSITIYANAYDLCSEDFYIPGKEKPTATKISDINWYHRTGIETLLMVYPEKRICKGKEKKVSPIANYTVGGPLTKIDLSTLEAGKYWLEIMQFSNPHDPQRKFKFVEIE